MAAAPGCASGIKREKLRLLSGVFDWLDFTIREPSTPLTNTRENVKSLTDIHIMNLRPEQRKNIKIIGENIDQLHLIVEGLTCLTGVKRSTADAIFEEVDIADTFHWVINQIQDTLKQRDIQIDIVVADKLSPISIDRRTLTECLLYLIRNAIQFLPSKGYLEIRVADMNEEFLTVLIINPCYYASQNEMGQRNLDELKK